MNGKGEIKYVNGESYIGDFLNGKRHGNGKLYNAKQQIIYQGKWIDDNMIDSIIQKDDVQTSNVKTKHDNIDYGNGESYVGELSNGKRDGKGTFVCEKFTFTGEWKDDKMHGKGEIVYKNGEKYVGEWRDNQKYGQGTYYFKNNDIFEANYLNDKNELSGKMIFSDGIYQDCILIDKFI